MLIGENEQLNNINLRNNEEIQILREKIWQLSSENEKLVEELHHTKTTHHYQQENPNPDSSFKTANFPEMERELRELRRTISDTENILRKKEEQLTATSRALEKKNRELDEWEARFKERGRDISPDRKRVEAELIAKDTRIKDLEQALRELQLGPVEN